MKRYERHIAKELERLRTQISQGDSSEIFVWVIPGQLACSQRPLRDDPYFGGRSPLSAKSKPLVVDWVQRMKDTGFRSIICLLEDAQNRRYYISGGLDLHPGGLVGYYEDQGFKVFHFPMTDYQRPSREQMERVLEMFSVLPKPVLLHCSAGIDRTAPVAAFIVSQHSNGQSCF